MTSDQAPPQGKPVNIGEYDIHCLSFGSGPAVVCLHGSGPGASAHSNFKHNVKTIVASGHRALLVDMIGFGYSSKPTGIDYTTALFTDTVKAVLNKLGIEECTMLGNSLGGAICIRMALDYPDRVNQLILMAPGGIETREAYFAMPALAQMVSAFVDGKLDKNGLRKILETLVFDASLITDELVNERYAILETQPPDVLSRMIIPPMDGEIKDIQCPIYGFWGQQDQLTPVTGATKFLENNHRARFTIFAGCGHWVMLEKADAFNAEIKRILAT